MHWAAHKNRSKHVHVPTVSAAIINFVAGACFWPPLITLGDAVHSYLVKSIVFTQNHFSTTPCKYNNKLNVINLVQNQ